MLLIFFFMAKDFNHLLSIHHLFDKTIHAPQHLLLYHEMLSAISCRILCRHKHDSYHYERYTGQRQTKCHHTDKHADNGNGTVNHVRDTLANHLTEGINVIGIYRHDISMGMGIKVTDGKLFHMGKEFITKASLCSLGYHNHNSCLRITGHHANQVKTCHFSNCSNQRCKIRCIRQKHGGNIIIN